MLDVSLCTERVQSEIWANIRGFVGRRVRKPADVDDIVHEVANGARPEPHPQAF